MTFLSNPYIAGDPVSGLNRFIGRADVLRDVLRTLRNPNTNAIVLFGQRRIGKTSVLLQLERDLATGNEYTPVYFDLQDKAALPLSQVLYQLAQQITSVIGGALPSSKRFDPSGDFFRDTFLPEAAQQATGQSLVLLFDEFDVLDLPQQGQAGAAFFPYLRAWMAQAERVQFVFVLGRRPEDLSTYTLSTFKALSSRQVSLMNQADSEAIIRQSEHNESLRWSDGGVGRVWYWTQGHPFLTQLLCSEVWEAAYDEEPETPPTVGAAEVDAAIDKALEHGANPFQWIWNGLPPAERIVMAAMAEAGKDDIGQDDLAEILNRSGVRLILHELELAPETLVRWDLLRPADGGFRFAVPLLRRWVVANKPLRRVKAELDSLEPLAENLYHSGEGMYNLGDLAEAERLLRRALDVNPNHFNARIMLGRVLLGQGDPASAVEVLEPAYEFDAPSARSGLVAALLALAEGQDEEDQLTTFDRILAIDPEQPVALEKRRAIWVRRAEAALERDELEIALEVYQQLGDQAGVVRVQTLQRKRELSGQLEAAEKHEAAEDWPAAIAVYEQLLAEFPDDGDWQQRLETARTQAALAEAYGRALNALQREDRELAQRLLGEVISADPTYKEAARYLLLAATKMDVAALAQQYREANAKADELQRQLDAETAQRRETEQEVARLQGTLEAERTERERVQKAFERTQKRAKPAEPKPSPETPAKQPAQRRQLSLWNPVDYLRLLWWVLIQPKKLKAYKADLDSHGKTRLEQQGSWLASTLTWWPLLAWVAWPLLDTRVELDPVFGYVCLAAVGLAWLLTGLFGASDDNVAVVVAVGVAVVVAVGVAVVVAVGVTATVAFGIVTVVGIVSMFSLSGIIFSHSAVVVDGASLGVMIGVAGGVAGGVVGGGAGEIAIAVFLLLLALLRWLFDIEWLPILLGSLGSAIVAGGAFYLINGRLFAPTVGTSVLSVVAVVVAVGVVIGVVVVGTLRTS